MRPSHVLYILLCTGRFLSTVISWRIAVASQIFVDQRVNLNSPLKGQTETVQCKPNVVSRQQVITNFSAPACLVGRYWTLLQHDQILRVLLNFFLIPIFLNILYQTLKKIALRAFYLCRGSKRCQRVLTQLSAYWNFSTVKKLST